MTQEHKDYASGLRQVADFIESHPEIDLPEHVITHYGLHSKEKAATVARALSTGGRCDKVFDDHLFTIKRNFGPIELRYLGVRSSVCEQVAVGKRVVPEQYVAPKPAVEGHTVPEHEETIYEWRCTPLLSKPDVEQPIEPLSLTGGPLILEAEYVDQPF